MAFGLGPDHSKSEFQNGRSKLGRFIYNENLFINIKRPRLAMVWILNGRGHEPNVFDHQNTEHVRYSSLNCI